MANLKYFAQSMTPRSSSSVGARTCLSSSRDLIEWPACQRQSFHRSSGTSFQRGTSRQSRMLYSYLPAMTMLAPPTTSPFYVPAPGRSTTKRNRPNYVPAIRGGREKRPRFHRAPPGPPTYVGAENEASLYNDYCAQGPRSSSGRDCALPGTHEAPGVRWGFIPRPRLCRPRARGLAVMTSLSHSEGHRFESGRAHPEPPWIWAPGSLKRAVWS